MSMLRLGPVIGHRNDPDLVDRLHDLAHAGKLEILNINLGDARRGSTIDCAALCLLGRRPLTRTGLGLLLVLLPSSISCSPFDSWLGFESSRRAYEKCRDENERQPESCERELRARDQDYGEYERDSEDLWGCERTPEGCSPRGPATDEYGRPTS